MNEYDKVFRESNNTEPPTPPTHPPLVYEAVKMDTSTDTSVDTDVHECARGVCDDEEGGHPRAEKSEFQHMVNEDTLHPRAEKFGNSLVGDISTPSMEKSENSSIVNTNTVDGSGRHTLEARARGYEPGVEPVKVEDEEITW